MTESTLRRIFDLLRARGPADAPTIARALGCPQTTVSSALYTLRAAGWARVVGVNEQRFKVVEALGDGPPLDGRGRHPNSNFGRTAGPRAYGDKYRGKPFGSGHQLADGYGSGRCELADIWGPR